MQSLSFWKEGACEENLGGLLWLWSADKRWSRRGLCSQAAPGVGMVEYFPSACKASFLLWSSVQSLWFINSVTIPGCHDLCSWWLKSHIMLFFIIPITPLTVWMPLNGFISHTFVLERYWWEAIGETGRAERRKEIAFLSGPQMRAGPRSPVLDFKYAPDVTF